MSKAAEIAKKHGFVPGKYQTGIHDRAVALVHESVGECAKVVCIRCESDWKLAQRGKQFFHQTTDGRLLRCEAEEIYQKFGIKAQILIAEEIAV